MNASAPFLASDLEELDARLLSRARRVIPMRDVFKGDCAADVIGLRHDVDDNPGAFQTALRLAEWEFEHGYSSTYFLLHDAGYWEEALVEAPRFEELGHEVGIHVNAIAEAIRQGRRDPHMLLADAISELRSSGVRVAGCVAHGDPLCRVEGRLVFVNDELFVESPRPELGGERIYQGVRISALPRAVYDLQYDPNWLSRGIYLSDSGGRWSQSFDSVVDIFGSGQLHLLIHPDWWGEAFVPSDQGVELWQPA